MSRLLTCILCAACPAFAQQKLSLKNAIEEALGRHPSLAAADHRVVAARAMVRQAGTKPNPRGYLQIENLRTWGHPGFSYPTDADNFAYVSQTFETAHKRNRRVDVAEFDVGLATLRRQATAREISARVAAAYWSGVAAAGLRDLFRDDLGTFESTVQYHRDRVQQGATAEVDLLRVLVERDRLVVAVRNAEQEFSMAILTLLREMGRSNLQAVELSDSFPPIRQMASPDIASAIERRTDMLAARAAIARANANLNLQRSNASPDPELLFGYKRTAGFDTVIAGLQVDIPFRNRNRGSIAAAEAEVNAAESSATATEIRIRGEIAAAYAEYSAKERLIQDTLAPMRDRAGEVARIVRAAYREGGMDLLRVLDAERTRIDALVTYYRALADYQQRVIALQVALGEMP